MDKPYTIGAARLITSRVAQAGPVDWMMFIDFIAGAVKALVSGCAPTPTEGVRVLTWRPWVDPFGWRTQRYRAGLEQRMKANWHGDDFAFTRLCRDLWESVDRGHVTEEMMRNLYSENV